MNPPRMLSHRVIRIADLAVTTDIIEDTLFESCHLVGPAVLAPLDQVEIKGCSFGAQSPLEVFWTVPTDHRIQGVIGLRRCSIVTCRMERISVVGSDENVRAWTKANFRRDE